MTLIYRGFAPDSIIYEESLRGGLLTNPLHQANQRIYTIYKILNNFTHHKSDAESDDLRAPNQDLRLIKGKNSSPDP